MESIHARYVYDSRGNPTVEVELKTLKGLFRAIVPSGASTGIYEALELRDKDKSEWGGKGVLKAVANVNEIIAPALLEAKMDVTDQLAVDEFMLKLDGTENKENLGANAILGVSMAVCRAGAAEKGLELYEYIHSIANTGKELVLPLPSFNVVNGGSHAGGRLALQEFMIMPVGASSFAEAMRFGSETYQTLKSLAKKKYGQSAGNVGDEGGIAPDINSSDEALKLITEAIEKAGYAGKIKIALDAASSEFFKDGKYDLDYKNPDNDAAMHKDADEMISLYSTLSRKYDIVSIEDPFEQNDWESWSKFVKQYPKQVVADDLTVTNPKRIKRAVEEKSANCLLLKINQIGTITEALQAARDSLDNNWGVMVSHRSGETEDTFIADLVVGLGCGQIKTGAPCRTERLAKLNQLLRIEEKLGSKAKFAKGDYLIQR